MTDKGDAFTLRVLGPHDERVLEHVADDVFDNAIDMRWTREFLTDPRHHIVVALHDDIVIGMATALHYVHPDKPPELWVNEVGVSERFQNRGIGRRLLAALFEHGKTLGCRHGWVATEKHNQPARRLYEVVGGIESPDDIVMSEFDLSGPSQRP